MLCSTIAIQYIFSKNKIPQTDTCIMPDHTKHRLN